ncbi:MAG: YbdD/YjiX family protein [Gemmatimonadetes bacterium]|nr:YbdD/YjiX family protein [Gemmatimonadota bacterium]
MSPRPTPIAERLQRVIRTVHRIIGAPDYTGYLAYMRRNHPGHRVMSREEHARECLDRRYTQMGNRCC